MEKKEGCLSLFELAAFHCGSAQAPPIHPPVHDRREIFAKSLVSGIFLRVVHPQDLWGRADVGDESPGPALEHGAY